MESIFDVIIVGYGPVGQIMAILLGQKGYHVGVFERWSSLYPRPRAVHYDDEVARIFQAAGVAEDLARVVDPSTTYEWRNAKGETLLLFDWSGLGPSGWPTSTMFAQPDLETVLSLVLRQFCRVYWHAVPDDTTLLRWAKLVGSATLERLNGRKTRLSATKYSVCA